MIFQLFDSSELIVAKTEDLRSPMPSLPCGEQWVCEQRRGPGLSAPRHRFKQQDVLLCQRHDHRPVLLPSTFQLDLKRVLAPISTSK